MDIKKNYIHGVIFALINLFSLGILGIVDKVGILQSNNPLLFSSQSLFFSLIFTFIFMSIYFKGLPISKVKGIPFSTWILIILVGIFGSGIFILLRFLGLTQSTGTFATLSQIITTSLTALLAWIFLKERLSKTFGLLFLIIISSMYFVSVAELSIAEVKTGDFLIIFSTIFLAASNIFSKVVVQTVSPILLSLGRFLFGFAFLFVSGFLLTNGGMFSSYSLWVVLSGLLWTVGVITFNLAIKKIGVSLATSLLMMAPVITMVLEYSLLGYQFNLVQVIAALVVVISGIALIFTNNTSRMS